MAVNYIDRMNEILANKHTAGRGGVRLCVTDGTDFSHDDIAHDFCMVEDAIDKGFLKVNNVSRFGF